MGAGGYFRSSDLLILLSVVGPATLFEIFEVVDFCASPLSAEMRRRISLFDNQDRCAANADG
jgi:hypothetical protein